MQKLRTIIADDIAQFNELLYQKLAEHCPEIDVIGQATNLENTYQLIKTLKPQLVILDVDFGGPTSFELLKKLKEENAIDFQIIFLTAYDDNSFYNNAFKFAAIQYLLKPLDHELLMEATARTIELIQSKAENQTQEQVGVLFENILNQKRKPAKEIMLKQIKKNYLKVELVDILYLESDSTMTNVYLTNGQMVKTVEIIGTYDYFTNGGNFFRISQSNIVNMSHISSYDALEKYIYLNNGTRLGVSRQKDKELRRVFGI
jgi:two-component system, LytTR family, response regulator